MRIYITSLEADTGYMGTENVVEAHEPVICEKGTKGHPLTDEQKDSNRQKSKTRCRVEHVLDFIPRFLASA